MRYADFAADIEARNAIRREAGLPLLDVAIETARLAAIDAWQKKKAAFKASSAPLRLRLRAKIVEQERRARRDPLWQPTGVMSNYWIHAQVEQLLMRAWRMGVKRCQQNIDERSLTNRL